MLAEALESVKALYFHDRRIGKVVFTNKSEMVRLGPHIRARRRNGGGVVPTRPNA
jgi:hypothetical protein